jgi:hypothetical protein
VTSGPSGAATSFATGRPGRWRYGYRSANADRGLADLAIKIAAQQNGSRCHNLSSRNPGTIPLVPCRIEAPVLLFNQLPVHLRRTKIPRASTVSILAGDPLTRAASGNGTGAYRNSTTAPWPRRMDNRGFSSRDPWKAGHSRLCGSKVDLFACAAVLSTLPKAPQRSSKSKEVPCDVSCCARCCSGF